MTVSNLTFPLTSLPALSRDRDRSQEVSQLVERESGKVLEYFLRRTTTPEDAADLLGETLLILWRRERSIPADDTQSRMWLYGIARKVLLSQRRSTTRRSALTNRLIAELTIQERAPLSDAASEVLAVMGLLDATDQEIIRLVYWDGFALAEAAQLLHLRAATVRSRHARARTRLREALGDHCE